MKDKGDRFKRVAARRTNTILKKLQILGNCANRSAYEYTDEDINRIFGEIEKTTRLVKTKFKISNNGKRKEFKL